PRFFLVDAAAASSTVACLSRLYCAGLPGGNRPTSFCNSLAATVRGTGCAARRAGPAEGSDLCEAGSCPAILRTDAGGSGLQWLGAAQPCFCPRVACLLRI